MIHPYPLTPGDGACTPHPTSAVMVEHPTGDAITAVASTLLNTKSVRLERASLTPKQMHAFCDHAKVLIRARVLDRETFTLLTDPQSIMAIGHGTKDHPRGSEGVLPPRCVGQLRQLLQQVVPPVQVDVVVHHGRLDKHRTSAQAVLRAPHHDLLRH